MKGRARKRFVHFLDEKEIEISQTGNKDDFFLSSFTLT